MSGCPGCLLTGKALQEQFEQTKKAAIDYSNANNVAVAIYRDLDGYSFVEMSAEVLTKYQIKEVITLTK